MGKLDDFDLDVKLKINTKKGVDNTQDKWYNNSIVKRKWGNKVWKNTYTNNILTN